MKFLITSLYLVFFQIGLAGEIQPATEEASIDCRKSIALTKTMEVYEGLPHQTKDSALFEKEIKREDITKIWNHPFYTPALLAKNAELLKMVLSSSDTIKIHEGLKRCGGFHPDYCVAWKTEGRMCQALICFGCREIVFLDGKDAFIYNLSKNAHDRLKELLSGYAKKRPLGVAG